MQQQASSSSTSSLAVALLIVSLFCLGTGWNIEAASLSGEHDPGARGLPLAVSFCLLACGVIELARVTRSKTSRVRRDDASLANEAVTRFRWQRVGIAISALVVYVAAVPWLGFHLSTLIFAAVALTLLGARWWIAVIMALVLIVIVHVVFGALLAVPLPLGPFVNLTFVNR